MFRPVEITRPRIAILLGAVTALLCAPVANAANLTYDQDANNVNGVTDASGGTWNTTNTNWFSNIGTADVAWPNTSADTATFGGGVSLSNGNAFTIATAGNLTANALVFNTVNSSTATTPVTQSYTLNAGATISLAGTTPTITVNSGTAAINAKLVSSSLIKDGSGSLAIANAQNSLGAVSINAGTLDVSASLTATDIVVSNAGRFDSHSGTTWNINSLTYNSTGSSNLTGLTGASTYTIGAGGLAINSGTVNAGTSGTTTANVIVNVNGPLTMSGGTLAIGTATTGSTGSAKLVLSNDVTSTGGTISSGGSGTESFDLNNATRTFTVNNVDTTVKTLTLSAVTTNGAITKAGTGILLISGSEANTFTGLTTVNGGTLKLAKTGNVDAIAGDIVVNTGAFLEFGASNVLKDTSNITLSGGSLRFGTGFSETFASLTQTAGTVNDAGNTNNGFVTVTGAVTATGGSGITLNSGAQWTVGSASFSGITGSAIGLNGNTTRLTLFTVGSGGLSINGQTFGLNKATATNGIGSEIALFGDLTATGTNSFNVNSGTTFGVSQLNLGAGVRTFNILSGTTTSNSDIVSLSDGSGAVTPTRTTVTGGLTKAGTGTLLLNGNNTYTGPTLVSEGTLKVGATALLDVTPIITVAPAGTYDVTAVNGGYSLKNGQTIAGGGNIAGATTVNSGAIVSPGTIAGDTTQTLTFKNGLNLLSGSTVFLDFGVGDNDKLSITGTVFSQANGAKIVIGPVVGSLTLGQTFDFLDFNAGYFASSNLGDTIRDGSSDSGFDLDLPDISGTGYFWNISNFTTTGVIEVVPEPGSALLLLTAGLGLLGLRRRPKA